MEWNGIDENGVPHESLNHYSKGAVTGWLIDGVCGIKAWDGKLVIKPQPDPQLIWAKAIYQSPAGPITCEWSYSMDIIWTLKKGLAHSRDFNHE